MKIIKKNEIIIPRGIVLVNNRQRVNCYEDGVGENDVFKIKRKKYKLEGIVANKKLLTIQNFSTEEKSIISESFNNFENIVIDAIVVRDDSDKLKVLEVKKINIDFDFKIKIDINMEEVKKITIKLNQYSILLKKLYDLVSMTGSIFYGDL